MFTESTKLSWGLHPATKVTHLIYFTHIKYSTSCLVPLLCVPHLTSYLVLHTVFHPQHSVPGIPNISNTTIVDTISALGASTHYLCNDDASPKIPPFFNTYLNVYHNFHAHSPSQRFLQNQQPNPSQPSSTPHSVQRLPI